MFVCVHVSSFGAVTLGLGFLGPSEGLAVTGRSLRCVAGRNGQTSMSSSDVRGVPVEPGPPDLAPFREPFV